VFTRTFHVFLKQYVVRNNVCEIFFFLPSPELQTCGLNTTMATSKEEEKEQFFNALYLLDHSSDDEKALKPLSMPLQRHSAANIAPDVVPLERSSKPTTSPKPMRAHRSTSSYIAPEAKPPQRPTMERRRPTTKRPPPSPVSSKPSNGKKGKQSKTIPEAYRIFTGSVFYFIPNDDVAAPRKMRIQRALQYGATWERVWSAEVTHVVVDSNIKMPDVLKNLRVAKLPVSILPCHVEVFLICFRG
jgi:DNA polymerase IV